MAPNDKEKNLQRTKDSRRDPRRERVLRFLEEKVWPQLPKTQIGRRLTRAEEDDLLGYGPGGFL